VLGGKLAAEVVAERAAGIVSTRPTKAIPQNIVESAARATPKDPVGVKGEGAIAFGAGAVMSGGSLKQLEESDSVQLIKMG
jgi:15-cis-phytoene desaturase